MEKNNVSGSLNNSDSPKRIRSYRRIVALLVPINVLAILLVGLLLYKDSRKMGDKLQLNKGLIAHDVAYGGHQRAEDKGQLVPLDAFLVNLVGSQGYKLVELKMELEVDSEGVQEEIEEIRPKIRDIIIILLSSKSYGEISSRVGKENLRSEIQNQVNLFLTKGRVRDVYFTQIIFS